MKQDRLWLSLIVVLVLGIAVTNYTKRYTSSTATTAAVETTAEAAPLMLKADNAAEAAGSGEAEIQNGQAAGQDKEALAQSGQAAGQSGNTAQSGNAARSGKAATRKEAAVMAEAEDAASNETIDRLTELDQQIELERAGRMAGANASKAGADSECKLWEAEIERMLTQLESELTDEEMDQLFQKQKEWAQNREKQADAASQKQSSTSLQELAYYTALTESTRARAYELAGTYGELLNETE